jgi:hypothetical protein
LRFFSQICRLLSSPLIILRKRDRRVWANREGCWRSGPQQPLGALNSSEGHRPQKAKLLFNQPSFVWEPESVVETRIGPKVLSDFVKIIQSEQIGATAGNFRLFRVFVRSLALTNSEEFFPIFPPTVLVKLIFRFLKMPWSKVTRMKRKLGP